MNIFVVSDDQEVCAQSLDDLRLNKMIIETAQLLSTAMRMQGYAGNDIYKVTHANHPCAIWARENQENYHWLLIYLAELAKERRYRTGKGHKSMDFYATLMQGVAMMPVGQQTPFANCSLYKNAADVYNAYRNTMLDKWACDKRPPKWTKRGQPDWI